MTLDRMMSELCGLAIRVSHHMTELVPYPRSPARARRRAALGHPQHHAIRPMQLAVRVGDELTMHPEVFDAVFGLICRSGETLLEGTVTADKYYSRGETS